MIFPALLITATALQTGAEPPAVVYRIEAYLDEPTSVLHARGTVSYRNESPDTLREVFFHLYLNAFRPHSLWARTEERPHYDFQSLAEPDYAFERLHRVEIEGVEPALAYPHSPDSTVVRVALPRPLPPGGSVVVELDWDARLSTLWRRQGRAWRHYDWAQWYPKVAVYDRYGWAAHPLYPQGEFYGKFATYDVTLDLPEDQVVAATGVPVEGDPGWTRAAVAGVPVTHQRGAYGDAPLQARGASALGPPAPGRKRVRFYAERVHHFAWLADPRFRYEEGRYGDVVLRVLYGPGSAREWGGRVLEYARRAMAWLDTIYGPYPWPQVTIAQRLEGGGTEFPMLVMNGGASEGLVVHELGHQYTYGILANNEWKEGWLDEGFTTFQSRWYFDRRYGPVRGPRPRGYARHRPALTARELDEIRILRMDAFGWSEPIATPAEDFSEFLVYNRMIYTKGSLVLEVLRDVLGEDVFRAALREYYRRYALRHVDETAFRTTVEDVCRCDLRDFFAQWLHGTGLVDYALGGVERERSGGEWITRAEVERRGTKRVPVEVAVRGPDGAEVRARADGFAARESVVVRTPWEPDEVVVDPDNSVMDWDRSNNYGSWGWLWFRRGGAVHVLDRPFIRERSREREVSTWLPLLWYNDGGGLFVGLRQRSNQMGWLDVSEQASALAVRSFEDGLARGYHAWLRVTDPPSLIGPRRHVSYAAWLVEDRWGGSAAARWDRSPRLGRGPRVGLEVGALFMAADTGAFLSPALWDEGETVEAWGAIALTDTTRDDDLYALRVQATLGLSHLDQGLFAGERTAGFARAEITAGGRVGSRGPWTAQLRAYAGIFADLRKFDAALPRQRRIAVAGAGPYETLWNPFLRSRGALFRRGDVRYHAPGGPNLRGYDPGLTGSAAAALNARLGPTWTVGPLGAVRPAVFADVGVVHLPGAPGSEGRTLGLADAGPGLEIETGILDERARLRIDFPVYLNRPGVAAMETADRWATRWVFSFESDF